MKTRTKYVLNPYFQHVQTIPFHTISFLHGDVLGRRWWSYCHFMLGWGANERSKWPSMHMQLIWLYLYRFLPQPFQVRSVPRPGRCRCQTLAGLPWHRRSVLYLLSPIAVLNYRKATKSWCLWRRKPMSLMLLTRKLRILRFVMSVICSHLLDIPELSSANGMFVMSGKVSIPGVWSPDQGFEREEERPGARDH